MFAPKTNAFATWLQSKKLIKNYIFIMIIIKKKPTSNSLRHKITLKKNLLCKNNKLIKNLMFGTKKFSGRSSVTGRITVRHKGGGVKKQFRIINTTLNKYFGIILGIVYDPFRNTFISLNFDFLTKSFFYMPAVEKLYAGSIIVCENESAEFRLGYKLPLKSIPSGTLINNLCINYNKKMKYTKAAGTFSQILQKTYTNCVIKLPSNKVINLSSSFFAIIGVVSNAIFNKTIKGKAGINRLKNIRPTVRGIAMNPVDHPHGGRSNGGFVSVTPWGKITRGKKTKHKK
jgi:large subunit ribosomal protein L2